MRHVILGLTGPTGAGKSTVAGLLAGLGFAVIDADQVAREVMEPGSPLLLELRDRFGGTFFVKTALLTASFWLRGLFLARRGAPLSTPLPTRPSAGGRKAGWRLWRQLEIRFFCLTRLCFLRVGRTESAT